MPDPSSRLRPNDAMLIYFQDGRAICCQPVQPGTAFQSQTGVKGSEGFGPFVKVEVWTPEGDSFLPPEWISEDPARTSMSPEGICVGGIRDHTQQRSIIGFIVYLPQHVVLTFERRGDGNPLGREHAFSMKWDEDDRLLTRYEPAHTALPAHSPPAEV